MNFRITAVLLLACLLAPLLKAAEPTPPPLMLATNYRGGIHVPDYWISEKLDGVRGHWDGQRLRSRSGQTIDAPRWFTASWPKMAMDGELWIGRGRFDETSGIVRAGPANETAWRQVKFMVFDLPQHGGTFDERVASMRGRLPASGIAWLQPITQFRLRDTTELEARLKRVAADGGEGLMLHRGGARYRFGRSDDLLKYKPHDDAEARVVAHTPGQGKYAGMLGALVVEQPDGRRFRIGTGFTDAQRTDPPPVGSIVTYRYNGLTSKGLPRFARFLRIRVEPAPPDTITP